MTILRLLVLCVSRIWMACGRGADEAKPATAEPKAAEAHRETIPTR